MFELYKTVADNTYLSSLALVVLGALAALLVEQVTTRVILALARRTKTTLDDEIAAALRRPLFFTVVLAAIGLAWRRLLGEASVTFVGDALLITIAVLLWARAGMRIGRALLTFLAERPDHFKLVQPRTQPLFEIAIKTLVLGGAAYGILLAWKVDVTAWLASAGIVGIAVGFAAKDTLANLFSGIFILADAPYKLGDYIVLGTGERGMVTDIGIRSTRVLTRDDIEITVPNASIANSKIVNESGGRWPKQRVRVSVGVAYGSDIDKVRQVLMQVAADSQYMLKEPEPRVRFREFGDSSLKFQLLGWIDGAELRGRALDELNTSVYKGFAAHHIEIPFPQHDVHLYPVASPANAGVVVAEP